LGGGGLTFVVQRCLTIPTQCGQFVLQQEPGGRLLIFQLLPATCGLLLLPFGFGGCCLTLAFGFGGRLVGGCSLFGFGGCERGGGWFVPA